MRRNVMVDTAGDSVRRTHHPQRMRKIVEELGFSLIRGRRCSGCAWRIRTMLGPLLFGVRLDVRHIGVNV